MVKKKNKTKGKTEKELLKAILITLLDAKSRDEKSKILKEAEFNKVEIIELIGISETTKRTRKSKAKKKGV